MILHPLNIDTSRLSAEEFERYAWLLDNKPMLAVIEWVRSAQASWTESLEEELEPWF